MDRYRSMLAFLRVAELGGFAPAARNLDISTSAVSRHVAELEDWLDIQLFNRTTRHVSLTAAGGDYVNRCRDLVAGMDGLESSARDRTEIPQGVLRISAPAFLGKELLTPLLPEFLKQYPMVKIELQLIDRFVNLVEEGFDVALRVADLADSTTVARRIASLNLSLVASPAYIEQYGEPKSADDLHSHNCLIDTAPRHGAKWPIKSYSKKAWSANGNVTVNSGEVVRDLAIEGSGIALLPTFFVSAAIDSGALVSLIEAGIKQPDAGVYLVYPQANHMSQSVRVFVDSVANATREFEP